MGNNCTRPPHFPPHCGCPAGVHDEAEASTFVTETSREADGE